MTAPAPVLCSCGHAAADHADAETAFELDLYGLEEGACLAQGAGRGACRCSDYSPPLLHG